MRKLTCLLVCWGLCLACSITAIDPHSPPAIPEQSTPDAATEPNTPDASLTNVAVDSSVADSSLPCTLETQHDFCSRYGALCGTLTATDNCGGLLTVQDCGDCSTGFSCIAGNCIAIPPPVPNCIPETDDQFCAQYTKNCGSFTNFDNCGGLPRTASCGSCAATDTCLDNICVSPPPPNCIPETDQAFCARIGRNCGTSTALDNCQVPRTVASCGSLRLDGMGGISVVGGAPSEIANGTEHVDAWVSLSAYGGNLFSIVPEPHCNVAACEQDEFILGVSSNGFLELEGLTSSLSVPLNQWIYVFAEVSAGTGYVGFVDGNGLLHRESIAVDVPYKRGNSIAPGSSTYLGDTLHGQVNNIRLWSISHSNADILTNYQSCLPIPQPGMIRQWCMLEGTGPMITDGVAGGSSLLNTAVWDTGACF